MDPGSLVSVARRWWAIVVLASLLAGAAGYLFAAARPVPHEARVRLLVGPISGDNDELRAAGQLTRTYGELVTGEAVIEGTIAELGLTRPPEALREAVRPTADSATRILIVRVRDPDAGLAASIANELAAQLLGLARQEAQVAPTNASPDPDAPVSPAGQVGQGSLLVVDHATRGEPVGVPTGLIVALGALAGLVSALTLVLLLESVDQSIRDPAELVEVSGVDHLGTVVPSGRPGVTTRGLVVDAAPDSGRAADHRLLATKLELIARRGGHRSLLVLGVGDASGAGELAANLSKVLADRRHCVTLLDADHQRQQITDQFALRDHPGLADLLERAEREGDEELHPGSYTFSFDPRLFVVPFGVARGPFSLHATGAPWILDELLRQADFLLMSAAPVHSSAASLAWAGAVDAVVLVVPSRGTSRGELSQLMETLQLVGTNVIGVVSEERRRVVWTSSRRRTYRPAPWRYGPSFSARGGHRPVPASEPVSPGPDARRPSGRS